jgi:hypothetical protein
VFRVLRIATLVTNIGSWMYNAAAGWLMTILNADPLMVSLVQAAMSLPMFLFALNLPARLQTLSTSAALLASSRSL